MDPPYYFISHSSEDNILIAPLIKRLLNAGIRLALDRPEDFGLSNKDFQHALSGGRDWRLWVEKTISNAAGFVYFSTPPWQESAECRRELSLAERIVSDQPGAFKMFPIAVSDRDFPSGESSDTRQRYRLFEAKSIRIGVDDRVSAFIQELHLHVLSLKAADGRHINHHERVPTIPLRIDRSEQSSNVEIALTNAANDAWPAFIYTGRDTDCLADFKRVSLVKALENVITLNSRYRPLNPSQKREQASISWPIKNVATETQEQLFNRFRLKIANHLSIRDPVVNNDQAIARHCRKMTTLQIIDTSVVLDANNRDSAFKLLKKWFAYWAQFPFEEAMYNGRQTVLPALQVMVASPRRTWLPSFNALKVTDVSKRLKALTSQENALHSRVAFELLPALSEITATCFHEWVSTDIDIEWGHNNVDCERFRNQGKVLFERKASLPMVEWVEEFTSIAKDFPSIKLRDTSNA